MGNSTRFLKKLLASRSAVVDDRIFRLHYKFTVIVLFIFGLVVSYCQFLGDPIDCAPVFSATVPQPIPVLDSYCWLHVTYSTVQGLSKEVPEEVPYLGIDLGKYSARRYNNFYQYVGFALLVQACLFYIPHYLWKCLASGTIGRVISDVKAYSPEEKDDNRKILTNYFIRSRNRNICYNFSYLTCEVLNVINVIGQLCFMNILSLTGYSSFGSAVTKLIQLSFTPETNPMAWVFPRVGRCTAYNFDGSGKVQRIEAVCTLNINVLNEKIYMLLYVWFIILAIVSCMSLVYKIMLFLLPKFRTKVLMINSGLEENNIHAVLSRCTVGDWFLLDLICKNVNPRTFHDLVQDLAECLEGKIRNNRNILE